MQIFRVLLSCAVMTASLAVAQSPAGSDWHRVQQLRPRTSIHVATDHKNHICAFQSADEDNLTCTNGHSFPRSEVKTIKLAQRSTSTLAGAGLGAAGGAIGGLITSKSQKNCSDSFNFCIPTWQLALAGTAVGAVPGAITGYFTDFAKGPVIYRRP